MIVRTGFALALVGMALVIPVVPAPSRQGAWVLLVPLLIAGSGLGLLVSQLNNYTLAPIEEERASEAAGVNSAGGNFGLSFGLAVAGGIMLATLSLVVHRPHRRQHRHPRRARSRRSPPPWRRTPRSSATPSSKPSLADEPADVQAEILAINDAGQGPARSRSPCSSPSWPACSGSINAFRMVRLPDIEPSSSSEGLDFG